MASQSKVHEIVKSAKFFWPSGTEYFVCPFRSEKPLLVIHILISTALLRPSDNEVSLLNKQAGILIAFALNMFH
jgi:hypothetical protein